MIKKEEISEFLDELLKESDLYPVEIEVTKDNNIRVEIDSDTAVDIDRCIEITKAIENRFDRDKEDYELEVGSSGLTSPFKLPRQYKKNIGNDVEVLTKDGKKLKGMLKNADEESFTIVTEEKVKHEGSKKPVIEEVEHTFPYNEVKYTKYLLKF